MRITIDSTGMLEMNANPLTPDQENKLDEINITNKPTSVTSECVNSDEPKSLIYTEKKGTPIKSILSVSIVIFIIVGGCYWNNYSSKNEIKDYATKELISKGYNVIEISVLEFKARGKNRSATGRVKFTVKNKDGVLLKGIATAGTSTSGGCEGNKKVFEVNEIGSESGIARP